METQKTKYQALREMLVRAVDATLDKHFGRLEKAVAGKLSTGNQLGGEAELLESIGLVEYLGDQGTMFSSYFVYKVTPAGKELYEKLTEAKENVS